MKVCNVRKIVEISQSGDKVLRITDIVFPAELILRNRLIQEIETLVKPPNDLFYATNSFHVGAAHD